MHRIGLLDISAQRASICTAGLTNTGASDYGRLAWRHITRRDNHLGQEMQGISMRPYDYRCDVVECSHLVSRRSESTGVQTWGRGGAEERMYKLSIEEIAYTEK